MRTAHIIISRILGVSNEINIGGQETYTDRLAGLLARNDFNVIVYEFGDRNQEFQRDDYTIRRVNGKSAKSVLQYIDSNHPDYKNDILIFSTDYLVCKNRFIHSVAIQHGVSWDVTCKVNTRRISNYLTIIKGAIRAIRKIHRYNKCNHIVCVDYNFVNWYRTQIKYIRENFYVIPNFADCPSTFQKREDVSVSIIFARRFVPYRGTRLFSESICNVLEKHPEIRVTIAGSGPDEAWMKQRLGHFNQVSFTAFESKDSVLVHSKYDIAVVPTLGSEGTSLSLLEAMAAGCAVISTNVGGMTNIILDGYNGKLINPEKKALEDAICEYIENPAQRQAVAKRAYETVKEAFSYDRWCEQWMKVINSIMDTD